MARTAATLLSFALLTTGVPTGATATQFFNREGPSGTVPNPSYDGRFTFARLRYAGSGCMTFEGPGWRHDYPVAERNLMNIMRDLTQLDPRVDSSVVFSLDDPELFKYPVAYLSEPGCWEPSASETKSLWTYLQKGGFLIVDDFRGSDWTNFETQMSKVLPKGRFVPIPLTDPIFNVFFGLDDPKLLQGHQGSPFLGIYEDNDPTKRLMVIANYNLDVGDFWQWSPTDILPVAAGNEAYKFGVNYIFYGLSR